MIGTRLWRLEHCTNERDEDKRDVGKRRPKVPAFFGAAQIDEDFTKVRPQVDNGPNSDTDRDCDADQKSDDVIHCCLELASRSF